ncbi:hypothetical protein N7490_009678 [Penicillium lividum]|nr:hypothetical protein N7490_009678 [Penicillium lividum]
MPYPKQRIETIINYIYAEYTKLSRENHQMVAILQQRNNKRQLSGVEDPYDLDNYMRQTGYRGVPLNFDDEKS